MSTETAMMTSRLMVKIGQPGGDMQNQRQRGNRQGYKRGGQQKLICHRIEE